MTSERLEAPSIRGSLLEELRAARDQVDRLPDRDLDVDPTYLAGLRVSWGEAISIVERFTNPMAGLGPEDLARLRESIPCLPGERHTFDAGAKRCLCGTLEVGIVSKHPTACLYAPTGEATS